MNVVRDNKSIRTSNVPRILSIALELKILGEEADSLTLLEVYESWELRALHYEFIDVAGWWDVSPDGRGWHLWPQEPPVVSEYRPIAYWIPAELVMG